MLVGKLNGVRYVEPNYLYRLSDLPDDALLPEQWQLVRLAPFGVRGAWAASTGAGITVAVIDSGVDVGHPDLAPNLWTNPREVAGNGVDDDGNGHVDDVHGWNFVSDDGAVGDDVGHGTAVAGVVAARGDNGIGVAGVAWRARVMALKVANASGTATADRVAAAIRYAGDNGARIVNVSLNGPDRSASIEEAIQAVQARGTIVVASAGNDGVDLSATPSYPASYPEDNVISVGSIGRGGAVSRFSNRGTRVDLYAPGEGILSTARDGDYGVYRGTSMAAPHVAGTLALMESARPTADLTRLRGALGASASPAAIAAATTRRLDPVRAVDAVLPAGLRAKLRPTKPTALRSRRRRAGLVTLRWHAAASSTGLTAYRVVVGGRVRAVLRATSTRLPRTSVRLRLSPGRPRWRIVAVDAAGRTQASAPVRVPTAP